MTNLHGAFVWYDIMTSDAEAARVFYSQVIGWKMEPSQKTDLDYTILFNGKDRIGGLMPLPEELKTKNVPPHWQGYIAVDDVDAYVKRIKEAGGSVCKEPWDIPNLGRFAAVADPHGATFIITHGTGDETPVCVPSAPATPGYVGWNELHAGEGAAAFAFYEKLFGWTKERALDMDEMGVYQTFKTNGVQGGGMMTKQPQCPRPFWLFYFNVDGIDDAIARAEKNGGKLLMGPHQVPTGQWVAQFFDPQGAMFAMLSDKR
ncbi:MAG TPA: VOC family protein [Rickettsiales bacterium]|nr:VOC family protein [Rickettsiales bacterium]